MSKVYKNQKEILEKLSIQELNPMQEEALLAIDAYAVLFSPTGTGNTCFSVAVSQSTRSINQINR